MIGVLFQRNMRQMMLPFVVILSVLIMYGGIIIYMYDPALINMLNDFQNLMPEMMQAFGMMGATNSLLAFCGTYLYGFLMLLFPLVFIVMMGNSYVMKYVDKGSLTVLLTSKNSRKKVIVTQAFSLLFATTILLLITTLSFIGIAVLLFPGELEITKFIILNVNLWLVQLVVAGIVFLAACIANENKYFYSIAVGIPLFFFLTNMLANMG
ncbi:MAG: ABC transporter permease, partial [Erysipelotrichaceae bacterium]